MVVLGLPPKGLYSLLHPASRTVPQLCPTPAHKDQPTWINCNVMMPGGELETLFLYYIEVMHQEKMKRDGRGRWREKEKRRRRREGARPGPWPGKEREEESEKGKEETTATTTFVCISACSCGWEETHLSPFLCFRTPG